MVYDYVITLKRPDTKMADWISHLLYTISIICFVFFGFVGKEVDKAYLLLALGILVCWVWNFFKMKRSAKVYFTNGLALAAIGWLTQSDHRNVFVGVLYIIAALAEREFKFSKEIGFSTDEVAVNSLFKRRYSWSGISNAMIREGIVTVDFKDNKIIQKEIAEHVTPSTEAEFNEFCKQQISAEHSAQSSNDV